jgi:hypothetical protein
MFLGAGVGVWKFLGRLGTGILIKILLIKELIFQESSKSKKNRIFAIHYWVALFPPTGYFSVI